MGNAPSHQYEPYKAIGSSLPLPVVRNVGRYDEKTGQLIASLNPYYIPNFTEEEFEKIHKETNANIFVFHDTPKRRKYFLSFVNEKNEVGTFSSVFVIHRASPYQ